MLLLHHRYQHRQTLRETSLRFHLGTYCLHQWATAGLLRFLLRPLRHRRRLHHHLGFALHLVRSGQRQQVGQDLCVITHPCLRLLAPLLHHHHRHLLRLLGFPHPS